jgi:hypothetical protein
MVSVIIFVLIFGLGGLLRVSYERQALKGGEKHRAKSDNRK